MENSDIEKGMKVRNRVSGTEGKIIDESISAGMWYVKISYLTQSGGNKGQRRSAYWSIENIEPINQ